MFVFKKKFLVSFQVSAIRNNFISKYPDDLPNINFKKNEYDQEISQSHTANQPMSSEGRAIEN